MNRRTVETVKSIAMLALTVEFRKPAVTSFPAANIKRTWKPMNY